MPQITADVRHAARRLAATPLLSLGAALILAVGIGSAVVMTDVLDLVLIRPPAHVTDPERLARVYIGSVEITTYGSYEAVATLHDELDGTAVYFSESLSLGLGERARRVDVIAHSPEYFSVLGVRPLLGAFLDATNPAREDTAVISYPLWQDEFGGSRDILGKSLHLGTGSFTIIGVAPRGFAGLGYKAADVWLPFLPRARAGYGAEPAQWKSAMFVFIVARLRPGVSREAASEHATAVYRASMPPYARNRRVVLGDIRAARAPGAQVGTRVEVLVAAMAMLVLLITCGNVANLLLVRGLRRDREFVVKTALGATRARLLREVLSEAILLAAGAGAASFLVVITAGTAIRRIFLSPVAALASPIDARVVAITVAFSTVAALLLGVTPAWRLTTRRVLAPAQTHVARPSRLLDVFSAVQIALVLPMIVTATLFVLSLWKAQHQDLGMETDHVAVLTTNVGEVGRSPWENHRVHRQIQARVRQLPQVVSTAIVQTVPMQGVTSFLIRIPGREEPKGPVTITDMAPSFNGVDPSFFGVMRMQLMEGRLFTDEDNRKGARPVAVISESMARSLWPGEPAVGKCFYAGHDCIEIIGIVHDARLFPSVRPTQQWAAACYLPIEQWGGMSSRALLVRTTGDPEHTLDALRREAQGAAPNLPYVEAHAFNLPFMNMLRPWRLGSIVFVVFGTLSVIVASVGLAVVAAYGVTRRRREIGIRAALGAQSSELVRLVLVRSLGVITSGLGAGALLSWASSRVLQAQMFEVKAADPRVVAAMASMLFLVGAVAAWLPARRAAHVDPMVALRSE